MKQHAYIAQRLPNVQHLHAEVTRQADWSKMLQLAGQLPALHSLHCTGPGTRKWWEASSSIIEASAASAGAGASAGLLPQLQALVFPFAVHGLAGIAALAPNLQQLWCQKLVLSSQAAGQARMQHVTHYGVSVVAVQADDTGVQLSADAVGSRFSAAFPALQVLFDVPAFQELEYQVDAGAVLARLVLLKEVKEPPPRRGPRLINHFWCQHGQSFDAGFENLKDAVKTAAAAAAAAAAALSPAGEPGTTADGAAAAAEATAASWCAQRLQLHELQPRVDWASDGKLLPLLGEAGSSGAWGMLGQRQDWWE
uniref:Uncharacterized protein n=1 Tax=Tetradesmus obliquus TaxID=3088 RepID=A0A383WCS2_TETOB|eukprot:jgi/Sobl393_1/12281/SZX75427.1